MSPIDIAEVKRLREKHSMTQRDLAAAAGLHQPRIAELEKGKLVTLTVDALERLAKALKVKPATLLK